MSGQLKRKVWHSVHMRGSALLEDGRPRRHGACDGGTDKWGQRGKVAFDWLLQHGEGIGAGVRCNFVVLGVAAALELDGVVEDEASLVREASLEFRSVRGSLRLWRQRLADTMIKVSQIEQLRSQRLRLRGEDWQLLDAPGDKGQAAHWRPPARGRVVIGGRTLASVASTITFLRGSTVCAGAVVRADGSETSTLEVLHEWPYLSIHIMNRAAAEVVAGRVNGGWQRPVWATMAQDERANESFVAVFLTIGQVSRCSLHADNVDSAWLVTAGRRDLWILPPCAARDALPDVQVASGRYDDTFSDYNPWEDENRHAAWRRVTLAVGDWVYMPRGWWHVVESSAGSVMVNIRV